MIPDQATAIVVTSSRAIAEKPTAGSADASVRDTARSLPSRLRADRGLMA